MVLLFRAQPGFAGLAAALVVELDLFRVLQVLALCALAVFAALQAVVVAAAVFLETAALSAIAPIFVGLLLYLGLILALAVEGVGVLFQDGLNGLGPDGEVLLVVGALRAVALASAELSGREAVAV